jgi:hypothetical protein
MNNDGFGNVEINCKGDHAEHDCHTCAYAYACVRCCVCTCIAQSRYLQINGRSDRDEMLVARDGG